MSGQSFNGGVRVSETMEERAERMHPWIAWRTPLRVTIKKDPLDPSSETVAAGLACRYCVWHRGIAASEVGDLSQTPEEFAAHLELEHGRDADV